MAKISRAACMLLIGACTSLSGVSLAASSGGGGGVPPYGNLIRAKQSIQHLTFLVQNLIARGQGGGGDGGGRRFPSFTSEALTSDAAAVGDEQENDMMATLALQGLGRELFELGQDVDIATANYGTPGFFPAWNRACHKDRHLIFGADAARVTAALPAQGFITPNDFSPISQELEAVRWQLFCP